MTTLPEFLLARLAEDEAAAREATPGPWSFESDGYEHDIVAAEPHPASVQTTETGFDLSSYWVAATSYDDQSSTTYNSEADGVFIARHDPARVLRQCEAIRRVVERSTVMVGTERATTARRGIYDVVERRMALDDACEEVLAALAAIWSDHPDYRQEWRP